MSGPYSTKDLRDLISWDGLAHPEAITTALNSAHAAGVAAERARVVEWLREQSQEWAPNSICIEIADLADEIEKEQP